MKIEMHTHTSEGSLCGKVSASKMVEMYANAGFEGIVLTNHYGTMIVDGFDVKGIGKWDGFGGTGIERSERYLLAYRYATEAAQKYHVKIFLGMELTLTEGVEDYLLYGIPEDFILNYPDIYRCSLPEVYKICQKENILLIQAHPCRAGYSGWSRDCRLADAHYIDGVELNQSPDHENHNSEVELWIKNHPEKLYTSGSDFHKPHFLASGWIETLQAVDNNRELIQCLKTKNYKCWSKKCGILQL